MSNTQSFSWDEDFFVEPEGNVIAVFHNIKSVKSQTENGLKKSYVINFEVIDHPVNDSKTVGEQISIWYNGPIGRNLLKADLEKLGFDNREEVPDPNVYSGEVFVSLKITPNEENPKFPKREIERKLTDEEMEDINLSSAF